MNTELLDRIKPKRQSDSNKAYIYKDKIILNFEYLDVIILGDTGSGYNGCISLSHKDLYSLNLDNGIVSDYNCDVHKDIQFTEYTITSDINSCFSAITGAGEDTYWIGYVSNNSLSFCSFGLNYYFNCYNFDVSDLYIGYNVFYYLFQFTKHLTGKKTDSIFISRKIDNCFYITNSDKSIYLKCYLSNKQLQFKSETVKTIKELYKHNTINSEQVAKSIAIENINSTLFKNFSRAYGDIVYINRYDYVNLIYNKDLKLWITKKLQG